MFWWGLPVMGTGAILFLIGLTISLIILLIHDDIDIPNCILKIVVAIDILGLSVTLVGFFFYCMSEIWGPYF